MEQCALRVACVAALFMGSNAVAKTKKSEPLLGIGLGVTNASYGGVGVFGPYSPVPINHPAHPDSLTRHIVRQPTPREIIDTPNGDDGDAPTIFGR